MHLIVKTLGAAILTGGLSACAAAPKPLPEPVLSYEATDCASDIELAKAITMPDDPKQVKRMMKNRTIVLSSNMDERASCLRQPSGKAGPYALFKLPLGIEGAVVYAGSTIDPNSMFAASVTTMNEDGNLSRTFDSSDYRKLGNKYGVQFRPRNNEYYVLISTNESIIGQKKETTETSSAAVYRGGQYGGGNDIVARTNAFTRTFSYDGEVGIRVVFPEQAESN